MHSGYKTLGIMITINAVIMFLLNYSMIDQLQHFRFNINAVYMALMMVAPMVILMLLFMRSMFQNKRLNTFLFLAFGVLFILTFSLTRTQGLVGDGQFLRSMIPHHSGAILMCQEAAINDPEISALCEQIISSQQEEIAQMEAILERNP